MRALLVVLVVISAACHPRVSVGYDSTAHTRGPLGNLQTIPRVTAVTGRPAPAPPEGRNVSLGVGFGDRIFTIGARVHANNISKSTLDVGGPQYVSAAAALDFRYAVLRWKGASASMMLAPSRTMLVDSTTGSHSWGSGIRFGGGLAYTVAAISLYAEAYEEKILFVDGPAAGTSTRTGVTFGLAFQP